jgi:hypothetical protein
MKHAFVWPLLALNVALPAAAQTAAPTVVPVEQAPYHVPLFRNEHVTVLNVVIPPNRTSGYHRHSLDTIGVLIADTDRTAQVLGAELTAAPRRTRGTITFSQYSRAENVHIVTVTGSTSYHNVVVELMKPAPSGLTPSARGEGYEQILDNERVRAWRLVLEPQQSAPAITQGVPGVRVVIDSGELIESVPGRPDRGMAPRSGEVYWQEAGTTRAVRNIGMTRIELVELELK